MSLGFVRFHLRAAMRRVIVSTLSPVPTVVRSRRVAGFTLVEMLVSVAIVLLMMSMFAQIFQMATGSLSQQRGIAENDQKARMLTTTLRGDLERRTFRDVFPFRAGEDTRQLGHSLARRAGYFEIDENDPFDDTDDVLSFTASVNIKLQNKDGSPFTGRALSLSGVAITGVTTSSQFTVAGDYTARIPAGSRIWIAASSGTGGITNNGLYFVSSATFASGTTTINIDVNVPPNLVAPSLYTSLTQLGGVYLSEAEPEFDDGLFGNDSAVSSAAEVCYFLRSGVLYRRVLLIREPTNGTDAQPTWTTGAPILWTGSNENYPTTGTSTFWRDFDYSAFYFTGKVSSTGTQAPGVRFHNAAESLSNSSQAPMRLTNDTTSSSPNSFPVSLGIPYLRFGHGTSGLPQDGSTSGPDGIWGNADDLPITFRRFNLRECSHSTFGYPGYIPVAGNPMNRTNLTFNYTTGLVDDYSSGGETSRRGEDILMSNVLSFDVKVWDPVNSVFVDVGDSTIAPGGPFSTTAPLAYDSTGTLVGGRLNTKYAPNGHYRFDTWHPSATVGGGLYDNEPPYMPSMPVTPGIPTPSRPFALSGLQITINYRDISSSQVRQVTIVQSLVDRVKRTPVTNEAPEE